jgi:hypothetical protein
MHNGRSLLQEQNAVAFSQLNPGNNKFLLLRQQAAAKMLQQRGSANTNSAVGSSVTATQKSLPVPAAVESYVAGRVQRQQAAVVPIPKIEDMPAVSQSTRQAVINHGGGAGVGVAAFVDPMSAVAGPRSALRHAPPPPSSMRAAAEEINVDSRVAKAAAVPNFALDVDDHGVPAMATVDRQTCKICQRQFAVDRLAKHLVVCRQNQENEKSRKVVDMRAKRVEGLYAANQAGEKLLGSSTGSGSQRSTGKWRAESAQFQRALKGEPTPADEVPVDDRIPCPHCGRKFGEAAASRHIPKCNAKPKGPR